MLESFPRILAGLSQEHLHVLNRYNKWMRDIVLCKDLPTSQCQWPLARIISAHPGKDAHIRVITISTEKGSFKQPANKVVLLLEENQDSPAGGSMVRPEPSKME